MLKQSVLIGLAMLIASATGVCAKSPLSDQQQLNQCHEGHQMRDTLIREGLVGYGPQTSMANAKTAARLGAQRFGAYLSYNYNIMYPRCLKAEIWAFKNPKLVSKADLYQ